MATDTNKEIPQYAKELITVCASSECLLFHPPHPSPFILKSGRASPWFFNAGTLSSGSQLSSLARCFSQCLVAQDIEFDVLFGPAYKGISLAAIVAAELARSHARSVGFAYNRKEAKDHGEGGQVVGSSLKGKRVVIVDDVITAGTATREAFEILRGHEAEVVGVVVALDRQEKGAQGEESAVQELRRRENVGVWAVMRRTDVQKWLELEGKDQELAAMEQYVMQYGSE